MNRQLRLLGGATWSYKVGRSVDVIIVFNLPAMRHEVGRHKLSEKSTQAVEFELHHYAYMYILN